MVTEDEFDPLPADMIAHRRAQEVGRLWGTLGEAWSRDTQRALAAYVPGQEWSFPDEDKPDLAAIRDQAVIARAGGRLLTALYVEHATTDIHTGDNYVDGCPTCDA